VKLTPVPAEDCRLEKRVSLQSDSRKHQRPARCLLVVVAFLFLSLEKPERSWTILILKGENAVDWWDEDVWREDA